MKPTVVKAAANSEEVVSDGNKAAAEVESKELNKSENNNLSKDDLKSQISAKVNELLPNSKVFDRFRVMLHQPSVKQSEGKLNLFHFHTHL